MSDRDPVEIYGNNLVPINVIDLTSHTIPYWELRSKSSVVQCWRCQRMKSFS